jgi:hypothetical protein
VPLRVAFAVEQLCIFISSRNYLLRFRIAPDYLFDLLLACYAEVNPILGFAALLGILDIGIAFSAALVRGRLLHAAFWTLD